MLKKIDLLIKKYKDECDKIIKDSTINGEFSYDCDYDDQVITAQEESRYDTLIQVINELEQLKSSLEPTQAILSFFKENTSLIKRSHYISKEDGEYVAPYAYVVSINKYVSPLEFNNIKKEFEKME